jgi:hypothetical protein
LSCSEIGISLGEMSKAWMLNFVCAKLVFFFVFYNLK